MEYDTIIVPACETLRSTTLERLEEFRKNGGLSREFVSLMGNIENPAVIEQARKLDGALRTLWLYDKYRLETNIIYDLNKEYGVMDWRLPEAQAIYWSSEGIRRSGSHNMQCSRIIATCLQEMMRAGRVLWTQQDGYRYLIMARNLDIVLSAVKTYDWAYDKAEKLESFRTGKINFMKNACVFLFYFGRLKETKEVFEILKKDDHTVILFSYLLLIGFDPL
jgi:hypothetical protein